jgi:CRISPR/Cas system-associated endonuclease/helicase Cas3
MDSYDEIYDYIVDNGYRKQIEDFFFDTLDNYCKRGKQKKHVIEQIMEQNDITYEIYYKKRNYHNGEQYDSVDIKFYIDSGNGRKPEALQSVYFKTIGNKIKPNTEPIVHGDFHWIFEVFRYLPSDVLTGYFTDKAKEYIEKILPLEYPR